MIEINTLIGDWDLIVDSSRINTFESRDSDYEIHLSGSESNDSFVRLADRETHNTVAEVEVENGDDANTAALMLMTATSHPELFESVAESSP